MVTGADLRRKGFTWNFWQSDRRLAIGLPDWVSWSSMWTRNLDSSWRYRILVGLATVVALALRLWPWGRLGLNQFDEGIYAMAAAWALAPGGLAAIDPTLIPYAPPGFPLLIGISSWIIGYSDQTGLLVSAFLGALTVPVIAEITVRGFGPQAAVAAAWSACLAGPHIAFGRMGLTDSSFLFVWSLGIAAALWFLRRPAVGSGLALGCLVGLAQQFKYNGWLLGAMVIGTVILSPLTDAATRTRSYWFRASVWGGLAVVVSWNIVAPWYRFVENHGGYSTLLAHQRSYLGGYTNWWTHLLAQVNQAVALSGPVWLTIGNAVALGISITLTQSTQEPRPSGTKIVLWIGLVWSLVASPVIVGLLVAPRWLWSPRVLERFLAVSWLTMFVLTPFYHPYARLWLPFELLHWILLGGLSVELLQAIAFQRGWSFAGTRWSIVGPVGVVAAGFLVRGPGFPFAAPSRWEQPGLFERSDSVRLSAAELAHRIPPEVTSLRTLVRPSVTYYLREQIRVVPQADVAQFDANRDSRQWGLVDSAIVGYSNGLPDRSSLRPLLGRWEIVAEISSQNSLPTTLDLDPTVPHRPRHEALATLWLLRLRTRETSP